MVEVRKAKELNDRLDLEIRALRNRVRCLDAEKSSVQQMVRYDNTVFNYLFSTNFFAADCIALVRTTQLTLIVAGGRYFSQPYFRPRVHNKSGNK